MLLVDHVLDELAENIYNKAFMSRGGRLKEFLGGNVLAESLEPLAYTRASSSEYWELLYSKLNPPYPRVAVFQKLLRSLAQFTQNKTYLTFWSGNSQFPSLD